MKYSVKKLKLFEDLRYSAAAPASAVGEKMVRYTNKVTRRDMEPQKGDYLTAPVECGNAVDAGSPRGGDEELIPAGDYLFLQGNSESDDLYAAAEALWLDAVWNEVTLDEHTVYVRYLGEDGRTVFQIFRPIVGA